MHLPRRPALRSPTLLAALLLATSMGCEDAQAPTGRAPNEIAWLFLYGPGVMYIGDTSRAVVHLRDADSVEIDPATRRIRWSISPAGVATVDSSGKIEALAVGSALLRVRVDDRTDTLRLWVETPPSIPPSGLPPLGPPYGLSVSTPPYMLIGDSIGANAAVMAFGSIMYWVDSLAAWSSNTPAVASVAPGGIIAGRTVGSAEISASYRGLSSKASVRILGPPPAWADFPSIKISEYGTCGVQRADGTLLCWGEGPPSGLPGSNARAPMAVVAGERDFVSTHGSRCGLKSDGTLRCASTGGWIGPTALRWRQFFVDRTDVSFGSCGLVADSSAVCWHGGDSLVTQVGGARFIELAMYSTGSGSRIARLCGIRADSTATCWTRGSSTLTPVATLSRIVEVKMGGNHDCYRTAEAEVWCVGNNSQGQLGNGTSAASETPTRVLGIPPAAALEVRDATTCAITVDHRAWCWGNGVATPALLPNSEGFTSLTLGPTHSCALKTDGSAWCWGENWVGQVGDGTQLHRSDPTRVRGSYPP